MTTDPAASGRGNSISFALTKATIVIGGYSFVNLAVGLMRGKAAAHLLGAAGIGMLAQANNFVLVASVICALGLAAGITNRLAATTQTGEADAGLATAATAFTVQLIVTAAILLLSLLLFRPLYYVLFAAPGLEWPFLILLVGLPLAVIPTGIVDPVFFGTGRYDLYTKASALSVALGLVPFLLLTYLWGLNGAIISIVVASALRLLAFLYYGAEIGPLRRLFHFRLDATALRHLFGFGWTTFIVAVAGGGVSLFIRSTIVHSLGPADNGLYQVPVAFSGYCTPFLTNGLWGHLYPYVSGRSEVEARDEVERALRMNVVTVTAVVFGLLLLQEWAIMLVFSREFLGAARFMPIQLLGDMFYFSAFTLSVVLLGLRRLKAYVLAWLGFHLLQGALIFVLLPVLGVVGVALGYTISALAFLALTWYAYAGRRAEVVLRADVAWLIGVSAACLIADVVIALVWNESWWLRMIPLAGWLAFMATRPEMFELLGWGVARTGRFRRRLGLRWS